MRTDLPSDVADDELNPQSDEYQRAALLVALLLRYPEIGSVRVSAPTADLTLSFLLSDEPEAARLETLKARIRQALGLLSRLEASALKRRCDFALRRQGPIVRFEVRRDLQTLVAEEFAIVLTLLRQYFDSYLIVEEDSEFDGPYVDPDKDDASISDGIAQVKNMSRGDELIGVRYDGRVLVFSAT